MDDESRSLLSIDREVDALDDTVASAGGAILPDVPGIEETVPAGVATVLSVPQDRGDALDDTIERHESTTELSHEAARSWVRVGRYVVLSRLGAGAMGVVLAAYDPDLDRKVALKLLKSAKQPDASARLLREAQALAKLDHPNVVAVHDVGLHEGQLFIGMEFVEGQTLGAWMTSVERPRPWREVLRVFLDAGRGLAAAHEAGLVHRDVKPDNVMLGADGRVRVMDFGLARAEREHHEGGDPTPVEPGNLLISRLTQTGALLGTPAYMSLEQFKGQVADDRSDQFCYCVALYEALYGERPFAGDTLGALIAAVEHGQLGPGPADARVPSWLRSVVARGLSAAADERWPSMQALLTALQDDPAARRRRVVGLAVTLALLVGGVWALFGLVQRDAVACQGMELHLEGVWDLDRRGAVERAMATSSLSYAGATAERVSDRLDDYAARWVDARVDACEATRRGEQSARLLDRRMACLDDRLRAAAATVDVLARADERVVPRAVQMVVALPPLDRCSDSGALMSEVAPPEGEETRRRVNALEERLAAAKALLNAGKYQDALARVDSIMRDAGTVDYPPFAARVGFHQGHFQARAGRHKLAEETLEQSFERALALRMHELAAMSASMLVYHVGVTLGRDEDGRRWAQLARPLALAVGTDRAMARYFMDRGSLTSREGRHGEALESHRRALELKERELAPDHPELAYYLNNVANSAFFFGEYEEARRYHERGLRIKERALGPDHPRVANTLNNLGVMALKLGQVDEARAYNERALSIRERALGRTHPDVARSLVNLGDVERASQRYDAARSHFERALGIFEELYRPEHPGVVMAVHSLGDLAVEEGRFKDARRLLERVRAVYAAQAEEHPEHSGVYMSLGELARSQGALAEARGHYERARRILEASPDSAPVNLAEALAGSGELALAQGRHEEARALFERTLEIREGALAADSPLIGEALSGLGRATLSLGDPLAAASSLARAEELLRSGEVLALAVTRFALARALWDAPDSVRDPARVRELAALAEQTRSALEAVGRPAMGLETLAAWSAEHLGEAR